MAMTSQLNINTQVSRFDTDSGSIGIDNRYSTCISHVPEDFVGTLTDSSKTIKGFAGSKTKGVKVGTLLWKWLDDNGKEHLFKIPDSYYVPAGGVRLLSPQHWTMHQPTSKKGKSVPKGTLSKTTSEEVTLLWNDKRSRLTVPLSKTNNVATFHMAPGYTRYDQFCMEAEIGDKSYSEDPIISS